MKDHRDNFLGPGEGLETMIDGTIVLILKGFIRKADNIFCSQKINISIYIIEANMFLNYIILQLQLFKIIYSKYKLLIYFFLLLIY